VFRCLCDAALGRAFSAIRSTSLCLSRSLEIDSGEIVALGLARFQQNMVQVLQTGQPCCTVFTMMISAGPFTPKYAWG
jgi:hypothetical protein